MLLTPALPPTLSLTRTPPPTPSARGRCPRDALKLGCVLMCLTWSTSSLVHPRCSHAVPLSKASLTSKPPSAFAPHSELTSWASTLTSRFPLACFSTFAQGTFLRASNAK
ncbi:hypothetical protein F3Y22_tig00018833pilonHSYRG00015 [Hibiscus syriacus]|uniref:Uncharacterized protein n=1 Tax=Hibiscus syriacus TaxID=106335 RepID=A0A6A3BYS7_HIBSY|nr:hypothetical protein F3Y22_tig00018833pilonHSYRG00015 [Hibiscus syriacus]